jgi:hypothetical protein
MNMTKQTTVDQGVLQMALIGYELKRDRIEAAIAEIQVELGQGGTRHSTATATDSSELKATGKKRFSASRPEAHGSGSEEAVGRTEGEEG